MRFLAVGRCRSRLPNEGWLTRFFLRVFTVAYSTEQMILETDYDSFAVVWSCSSLGVANTREYNNMRAIWKFPGRVKDHDRVRKQIVHIVQSSPQVVRGWFQSVIRPSVPVASRKVLARLAYAWRQHCIAFSASGQRPFCAIRENPPDSPCADDSFSRTVFAARVELFWLLFETKKSRCARLCISQSFRRRKFRPRPHTPVHEFSFDTLGPRLSAIYAPYANAVRFTVFLQRTRGFWPAKSWPRAR